ncbi:glycoside hydrolase family 3 N-terminal domain-containing protein [Gracilinema caldarium]|uniref:glycoside hydrolase family 3 protein n=1 Tax=Gracilinema caldarium TaxID=215591 RepID=UPI0026F366DB|nr:glycoside hydrolase family 3 N-terminal domain-containing protein [Gracilinema caldarium]
MKKIKKLMSLMAAVLGVFYLSTCTAVASSERPVPANAPYKNPAVSIEKRVEDLLSRMSLEEKIGQMTQIERGSLRSGDISRYKLGSILSGGGGAPSPNTITAWQQMLAQYQEEARNTRLQIPLLYGIDAVHGHNNLKDATIFPHNIGLGAADDPDLVRRIGAATAAEMEATGIYWNFAPCIAVGRDPRWGRFYESFGQDSSLVASLGSAYIQGFQEGLQDSFKAGGQVVNIKPIATAKHFIGDGGTRWGTSKTDNYKIDQGDTAADEQYLKDVLFPPYQKALESHVRTVMVSFSSMNGLKMHAHKELITTVLKQQWGFSGFVVSDWGGIDQVDPDYSKAVAKAINAGIDMVMVPYDANRFINTMTQLVKQKQISMDRIDDAVGRILRVKFEMGLFDAAQSAAQAERSIVRSAEHLALAREAVAKSVVVLKNNGVLPLNGEQLEKKTLYVAGFGADNMGIQCGGWTISWQGSPGPITQGTTILGGLKELLPNSNITYDAAAGFEKNDPGATCVVVVGELPYAEGKGDSAALSLPPRELEAIQKARKLFKHVILVILSGRPVILDQTARSCDAIVAAWLPGSEGAGVADVLTGKVLSTGKLPCDWPESVEQLPLDNFILGKEKALFPIGWHQ